MQQRHILDSEEIKGVKEAKEIREMGKEIEGIKEAEEATDTSTPAASTVKDDLDNITVKPACNPGNMQPYQQWMNTPSEMIYMVAGKNLVAEQELHKKWVVPWYSTN